MQGHAMTRGETLLAAESLQARNGPKGRLNQRIPKKCSEGQVSKPGPGPVGVLSARAKREMKGSGSPFVQNVLTGWCEEIGVSCSRLVLTASFLLMISYIFLWVFLSAAVILLNKYVLAYSGFPYPISEIPLFCMPADRP